MPRVVLDTNVLVSAIICDGKSRELLKRGIENQFSIVTSDPILRELARVLRRPKFKTSLGEARRITLALMRSAEIVDLESKLRVVKDDPKDDMVIETAVDGHADIVVSGDSHLLELESFRGTRMLTVEQTLAFLRNE